MQLVAAVVIASVAGCTGWIGDAPGVGASAGPGADADGGSSSSGATALDGPTRFACDPSQKPAIDSLRALTTAQYMNTVSDLVSWALGDPSAGPTVLGDITGAMASLPPNVPVVPLNLPALAAAFPDGGWLRADQDQQITRITAFYNIGNAVGQALVASGRLGTLVGSCATDADPSNDAACLTAFIQKFASRALRRPLTSDDVTLLTSAYGSDPTANPAAYADLVALVLNMPDFLYFVEHGDQPVAGVPGVYTLAANELATRLSYAVWDTMPDDTLWATALDGSLLTDAVYQQQVARLFGDPRAQATMHRFFEDYFQVNSTGGPRGKGGINYHDLAAQNQDPVFQTLAGSDLPSPSLVGDLVADAVGTIDYYTWQHPGTTHDLLTTNLSFAKSPDVAKLYGLPPWDGASWPPAFPAGQRPGLFTRALFLAAGSDTNPILKGVYLRRYVMCDTLGPPPAAAANAMITLSPTMTTRQVTEQTTSIAPCNSCHPHWINPLGFATEDFDGLGRHRTMEILFNPDGSVATKEPVDTGVVPYVMMGDSTTQASGAADLMNLIDGSQKFGACLTRNYFRYAFGRFEDLTLDGCSLEQMRSKLDSGGHIADMLEALVQTPEFKRRAFQ